MDTRIGGNIMINTKNIEEKSTAYKIRKSGNSDIVTVPSIVKDSDWRICNYNKRRT